MHATWPTGINAHLVHLQFVRSSLAVKTSKMASLPIGKLAAAAAAAGGAAMVFMSFNKGTPEYPAKMTEEVKRSPLKKTLSNAGLYPQPDGAKNLKRTASGSMAVFTSGEPGAALTKGGGDPM